MHLHHTALLALVATQATAHIVMKNPRPFDLHLIEGEDKARLELQRHGTQIFPVEAGVPNLVDMDGALDPSLTRRFPCQEGLDGNYTEQAPGPTEAGSNITVEFIGSAIHGGGSCQFSVAEKMSADAKDWKVIHSVLGGCPGTSAGNLETTHLTLGREDGPQCPDGTPPGKGQDCVRKYSVPIPKEIKNGKYFFSWSWFNQQGNNEMYQNCAPLEIVGGSEDDKFLKSLPDMFIANIPGYCNLAHIVGLDLEFPDPGKSIERGGATDPSVLGKCAEKYPDAKLEPHPSPVDESAPAASAKAPPTIIPIEDEPTSTAVADTCIAPDEESPPKLTNPTGSSVPAATGKAPTPDSASGCEHACTGTGIICIDEDHFGLCDRGCAKKQPVAPGTTCGDGQIRRKRGVRVSHLHVHPSAFSANEKRTAVASACATTPALEMSSGIDHPHARRNIIIEPLVDRPRPTPPVIIPIEDDPPAPPLSPPPPPPAPQVPNGLGDVVASAIIEQQAPKGLVDVVASAIVEGAMFSGLGIKTSRTRAGFPLIQTSGCC